MEKNNALKLVDKILQTTCYLFYLQPYQGRLLGFVSPLLEASEAVENRRLGISA